MGDMGEAFEAFNEHKRKERERVEPRRIKYASNELARIGCEHRIRCDRIILNLPKGTMTFYPHSGWFQGQKPYGRINGRGIKNLLKELGRIVK